MSPVLQTSRLVLRPLELEDAAQVQVIFPHWEVVRFLTKSVPWPYPSDGAYTFYRDVVLPAVGRGEAWHWTLRLKESPEQIIGSIALTKNDNKNRGFWLGLPWRGRGLMSEACVPVTDFWFDVLQMPVMRIPKAAANGASRRISEKSGMRVIRTDEREYVGGRFLTELWEITAEEWRAHRATLMHP